MNPTTLPMRLYGSVQRSKPVQKLTEAAHVRTDRHRQAFRPKQRGHRSGRYPFFTEAGVKQDKTSKDPSTTGEIPVPFPDEYATHLISDNGAPQRLLIFASNDGLRLLETEDNWYMDGTHLTSPSQFQQLFVILVPLGNTCCIRTSAIEASGCLQRDLRPNPIRIIADYEVAIHNAVRNVRLSDVHIRGCFYHLTQAKWRHVQAEGLQTDYRLVDTVRKFCGKLDGLASLPIDDVEDGIAALSQEVPDKLGCLPDYFDTNYVRATLRSVMAPNGNMRYRRIPPRFPPALWNVHEATINSRDRINNQCESWNNSFKHLDGHINPYLWTVARCLEKDAIMVSANILSVKQNNPLKSVRRRQQKEKLKSLCEQYVYKQKNLG